MRFCELIKNINDVRVLNQSDAEVSGIAYDSRKVQPGYIFVAMQGGTHDGHKYISSAIDAGAVGILAEHEIKIPESIGFAIAPDGRKAMGEIAAPFYDYPSRKLKLIGVTGTSGKTTVTYLIHSIFNKSGQKAGLIGTLGAKIGDEFLKTEHTTPESADLQAALALMVEKNVEIVAMEVSSHGLYQGRVLGCEFDCGVFTNIARDHLDFHITVDAYFDAKLMLFRDYPKLNTKDFISIVNADDEYAEKVINANPGKIITFGIEKNADLQASEIKVTDKSVSFILNYLNNNIPIALNIGGYFNVYNALSAAAACIALGLDLKSIADGLADAKGAPGRFESVECGQDFGVLVDYAHTPDELENVLSTARNLTKKRLITVFGCGGDRDKGKRPIMGKIGVELADIAVITSDNPRTEKPSAIIDDILQGIDREKLNNVIVNEDRESAIFEAVNIAKTGDIVVIAGKGHEDYQIFADRTIHFDDKEVARKALEKLSEI